MLPTLPPPPLRGALEQLGDQIRLGLITSVCMYVGDAALEQGVGPPVPDPGDFFDEAAEADEDDEDEGPSKRYWRQAYPAFDHATRRAQVSAAHHLALLLHRRGVLHRVYTQNREGLEERAGLPADKVVYLNGRSDVAQCLDCGGSGLATRKAGKDHSIDGGSEGEAGRASDLGLFSTEWIRERGLARQVPSCESEECLPCLLLDGGQAVADFDPDWDSAVCLAARQEGQPLSRRFRMLYERDLKSCDLLICVGASLVSQPDSPLILAASVAPDMPPPLRDLAAEKEAAAKAEAEKQKLAASKGKKKKAQQKKDKQQQPQGGGAAAKTTPSPPPRSNRTGNSNNSRKAAGGDSTEEERRLKEEQRRQEQQAGADGGEGEGGEGEDPERRARERQQQEMMQRLQGPKVRLRRRLFIGPYEHCVDPQLIYGDDPGAASVATAATTWSPTPALLGALPAAAAAGSGGGSSGGVLGVGSGAFGMDRVEAGGLPGRFGDLTTNESGGCRFRVSAIEEGDLLVLGSAADSPSGAGAGGAGGGGEARRSSAFPAATTTTGTAPPVGSMVATGSFSLRNGAAVAIEDFHCGMLGCAEGIRRFVHCIDVGMRESRRGIDDAGLPIDEASFLSSPPSRPQAAPAVGAAAGSPHVRPLTNPTTANNAGGAEASGATGSSSWSEELASIRRHAIRLAARADLQHRRRQLRATAVGDVIAGLIAVVDDIIDREWYERQEDAYFHGVMKSVKAEEYYMRACVKVETEREAVREAERQRKAKLAEAARNVMF